MRGKGVEERVMTPKEWKDSLPEGMPNREALGDTLVEMWQSTEGKPQEISEEVKKWGGKGITFEEWARLHADELLLLYSLLQ